MPHGIISQGITKITIGKATGYNRPVRAMVGRVT